MSKFGTDFIVMFREINSCLQETKLTAAVITSSLISECKDFFASKQLGNTISELDFTAHSPGQILKLLENSWCQDVPPRNRESCGSYLRSRLFNNSADIHQIR